MAELEKLGIYRHYKGGLYRLLHHALNSDQKDEAVVVYLSLQKGIIWTRPQARWSEAVTWPDGGKRPRFEYVGEVAPELLT